MNIEGRLLSTESGAISTARRCSIVLGTVHEYLQRAEAVGLKWPLPADWDEDRLNAALFGPQAQRVTRAGSANAGPRGSAG